MKTVVKKFNNEKEFIPVIQRSDYYKYLCRISDYQYMKTNKNIAKIFVFDERKDKMFFINENMEPIYFE